MVSHCEILRRCATCLSGFPLDRCATRLRHRSGIAFLHSACKLSPASPPRAPLSAHRPLRFPGRVFLAVALLCLIAGFEISMKAILAAFTLIVLVPALTPAQTRHEGGRGIPSSTSGGTPESGGSDSSASPNMPPSGDTPSTPGTWAPRPSTGSPSTPSRRLTNQADCERAAGEWHGAENKCETGR